MLSPDAIQELLSSPPTDLASKVAATVGRGRVSAREVADACGVTVQAINGWKTNGRVAKQHIKTLARLTGLPVSWWLPGDDGQEDEAPNGRPWPFSSITEADVRRLSPSQLNALDGAIALAVAQLRFGLNVSKVPAHRPAAQYGGLVDIDAARDEFPMALGDMSAAPWDGGKTTRQSEQESLTRLSRAENLVANVSPGEPHPANDKFEKVAELADVRLAAGDGIENHGEEQTGVVQFRRSFLRSVGADGGRGRVVYARGDSMEPDIKDGWALLVVPVENLLPQDIVLGNVYAINYDGKMLVKTVTRDELTGRWVARSKNRRYQDIPLQGDANVRILGPVVWAGGILH